MVCTAEQEGGRGFVVKSLYCVPTIQENEQPVSPPPPSLLMGKGRWHLRGGGNLSGKEHLSLPQPYSQLWSNCSITSSPQGQSRINPTKFSLATNRGGKGREKYKSHNIHRRDKSPARHSTPNKTTILQQEFTV